MQNFLFNIANTVMKFTSMLGDGETEFESSPVWQNTIEPIVKLMENILVPLLILVGTAGSIYAVVLGVNYARAEDSGKREEAKKRLINAVIGLVVMVALLIVLWLFTKNAKVIVDAIRGVGGNK